MKKNYKWKILCNLLIRMVALTVIIAVCWGIIRWGWIRLGILSNMKSEYTEIGIPVVLAILITYLCRHEIIAVPKKKREIADICVLVFAFSTLLNTSLFVKKMCTTVYYLPTIHGSNLDVISKADYLKLDKIRLDKTRLGSFLDTSVSRTRTSSTIYYHLFEVFPVENVNNIFVGKEITEQHPYSYASDEELDLWALEMRRDHIDDLGNFVPTGQLAVKRIHHSDNFEGYLKAVANCMSTTEEPIIFELTTEEPDKNIMKNVVYSLVSFLISTFLLLIIYASSYISIKQYQRSMNDHAHLSETTMEILKKPSNWLILSIPIISTIVYLLMVGNGYDMHSGNSNLFMRWGAFHPESVLTYHEWWRVVTAVFIHDGLYHLLSNMICYVFFTLMLYMLYPVGPKKLFTVFMVSGIGSFVCCLLFSHSTVVGIGASGGVFGLVGYMLVAGIRKRIMKKESEILFIIFSVIYIVLNLLLSLRNGVSMSGHLGGLVIGCILGILINRDA